MHVFVNLFFGKMCVTSLCHCYFESCGLKTLKTIRCILYHYKIYGKFNIMYVQHVKSNPPFPGLPTCVLRRGNPDSPTNHSWKKACLKLGIPHHNLRKLFQRREMCRCCKTSWEINQFFSSCRGNTIWEGFFLFFSFYSSRKLLPQSHSVSKGRAVMLITLSVHHKHVTHAWGKLKL